MSIYEIILIAVALSMDAFAVSICKGLCMRKINYMHTAIIALFMGVFQALMPVIGWVLGKGFENYISDYDHWIAFVLLAFIGGKMIYESLTDNEETKCSVHGILDIKELFLLAIATSIDAMATGVTFAVLEVKIIVPALIIGVITYIICFMGVMIGNRFGTKYKSKAEIAGGIVLVLFGLKILLEHLGIINI